MLEPVLPRLQEDVVAVVLPPRRPRLRAGIFGMDSAVEVADQILGHAVSLSEHSHAITLGWLRSRRIMSRQVLSACARKAGDGSMNCQPGIASISTSPSSSAAAMNAGECG